MTIKAATTNNVAKMAVRNLPEWLAVLHKTQISGMIHGIPGCGKTASVKQYAQSKNLPCHIILLSQSDPTDFKGIPALVMKTVKPDGTTTTRVAEDCLDEDGRLATSFFAPSFFPDGPGVVVFDEINQGLPATMSAAQSILLERRSGDWVAHPELLMVATGNRLTDKTNVNALPSALDNRMCHVEINPEVSDFINYLDRKYTETEYAKEVNQVVQFFEWRPEAHHKFQPDLVRQGIHGQPTWRTWEMSIKARVDAEKMNVSPFVKDVITTGLVGVSYGTEYNGFVKIINSLENSHPKKFMEKDNSGWEFPLDPGVLHAFFAALPEYMRFDSTKAVGEFSAKRFVEIIDLLEKNKRMEMVAVFTRAIVRVYKNSVVKYPEITSKLSKYLTYMENVK